MEQVPCVKVNFQLGSETYLAEGAGGLISDQLVSIKERTMAILNQFITAHNMIPDNDDQVSSSDEDDEIPAATPPAKKKSKNQTSS